MDGMVTVTLQGSVQQPNHIDPIGRVRKSVCASYIVRDGFNGGPHSGAFANLPVLFFSLYVIRGMAVVTVQGSGPQ